jgi:hypothetical protein
MGRAAYAAVFWGISGPGELDEILQKLGILQGSEDLPQDELNDLLSNYLKSKGLDCDLHGDSEYPSYYIHAWMDFIENGNTLSINLDQVNKDKPDEDQLNALNEIAQALGWEKPCIKICAYLSV